MTIPSVPPAADSAREPQPCPLCDGEAFVTDGDRILWVGCYDCDVGTRENFGLTQTEEVARQKALARWNRREGRDRSVREALESIARECDEWVQTVEKNPMRATHLAVVLASHIRRLLSGAPPNEEPEVKP